MDVRLPNGAIIQNVPEGTTKAQLVAKLRTNGYDTSWAKDHVNSPDIAPENRADYQYDPTSGMSTADKFFAGAGKAAVDMGRGLRQIGAEAGQALGFNTNADQLRQEQDAVSAQDAPLMQTGAGIAGNIAGNIAATYAGGSMLSGAGALAKGTQAGRVLSTVGSVIKSPSTIKGAASVGAGLGAIQPVGTDDSRLQNSIVGGATGALAQGIATVAGKIGKGVSKPSGADARSIRVLEQEGVPLDAAQRTGSTFVQRVKAGLSDNPITAGGQVEAAAQQKAGFTRAVLAKIGVNADAATPDVMGQARDDIGSMFKQALDGSQIRPSQMAINQLQVLASRSKRILPGESNQITRTIDDISAHLAENGGKLDGKYYQMIRGDLSSVLKEPGVGQLAGDLINGLDNSFQQSVGPEKGQLYREARRLWRNMTVIEKAVAKDGGGEISPALLANQFGTKANRAAGVYGKGDRSIVELAQLAKAGKRIIPEKLPNSGTAARVVMQAAAPTAAGMIGGVKGYREDGWGGALKGAAIYGGGAVAAPMLAQRLINSPGGSNYLANGLDPGVIRNALLTFQQGGGPLRLAPVAAVNALSK